MPRGIFRLKQVYEEQLSGNWSTKVDVWNTPSPFLLDGPAPFGYVAGGEPEPGSSTVDRIDYSNDTATALVRGPLSSARYSLAATGNSSFAYFAGGGVNPGNTPVSTVDRTDYSNDTPTAVVKGPLSAAKRNLAATGNTSFGYFAGGFISGTPATSTVERIDYSNDTATALAKGPLGPGSPAPGKRSLAATGNQSFGYFGGGTSPAKSDVHRIDYGSDTVAASPKGPLSVVVYLQGATGNSSFGYFGGGTPGPKSTVDRIDYSSDTGTAPSKGPLSITRYGSAATGNASFGYFGGGVSDASAVERIDYGNDTATAVVKGPLSRVVKYAAATSRKAYGLPYITARGTINHGYFGGGTDPAPSTSST